MSADEFYSMTWGNFQRRILGYVKRRWTVNRDIIAAIYDVNSKKRVKGEDIFPFGLKEIPPPPSDKDREYMRKRHEHRLKHGTKRSYSKN